MVALDGNFSAWELLIACPLTPKPVRIQLDLERGVGFSETTLGWAPVSRLATTPRSAEFAGAAGMVEGRFVLAIAGDTVEGEFHMTDPFEGVFPLTGAPRPSAETLTLTAEAVDTRAPYLPVLREAAPLPGYTLYRPADAERHPVVVWGNGGGSLSNEGALTFLTQLAAAGYAVIAPGAPSSRSGAVMNDARPQVLLEAVGWAASGESPHLDGSAIAVMGHSMGGVQSWAAAAHPAVSSLASWNGSSGPALHRPDVVAAVTVPTLIVTGGATDGATPHSLADFAASTSRAPLLHIENRHAGHGGIFHGMNDAAAIRAGENLVDQEIEVVASVLAIRWLNYTLRRDQESASYFSGETSTIAGLPGWSVLGRKNF